MTPVDLAVTVLAVEVVLAVAVAAVLHHERVVARRRMGGTR